MRKLNENNQGVIGIIIGILLLILIVWGSFVYFQSQNDRYQIKGTVTAKWIDNSGSESHYLLKIRMVDGQPKMLEVNRNMLHGSYFNPDFVYSDIKVNSTYMFTCWGWDWQWSGIYMYPNVIISEEL